MSNTWTPVTLMIDTPAVLDGIKNHFLKAIQKAEKKFITLMRQEIRKIDHEGGGGHGAPEWEGPVISALQTIYRESADGYIESAVGVLYQEFTPVTGMASVYEFGAGNEATPPGQPIQTKPGEIVWKDDMTRGKSNAKSRYPIDHFNQEGSFFLENAIKEMQKYWDDILEEACDTLPSSLFYKNVHATVR